jgi:starch synthase (maltosyl-transferring)
MIPASLRALRDLLVATTSTASYAVPGRWVDRPDGEVTFASAPAYFLHQLDEIEKLSQLDRPAWSYESTIVYNGLLRHITAWQHGEDATAEGWCVNGSFVKMLALLPYLHALHVTTLSLLPLYERGVVGRKGTLGSPYAIRHPLRIDHDLAESCLHMSPHDQLRCLVDACHALGIKVVFEFVPRTASIDSDLVAEHPQWFYWVKQRALDAGTFRAPVLGSDDLLVAKELVALHQRVGLPEPEVAYQALFTSTPHSVQCTEHGWAGTMPDGMLVGIPGAFADWPPDDPQPAWSDVTYLRLHDHPHFRYMAYNTVRMYDALLDLPVYRQMDAWDHIASIIPWYIDRFDIDGALIDMGHALPEDLQRRLIDDVRARKPDFMFWEENFFLQQESRDAGYDAVVGYLPFDAHDEDRMEAFLQRSIDETFAVRYFGTPETHNTPRSAARTGSPYRSLATWAMIAHLPKALPFIHAGIELGEVRPVNTGLGFTAEEQALFTTDDLALFSSVILPWTAPSRLHTAWKQATERVAHRHDVTSVVPR